MFSASTLRIAGWSAIQALCALSAGCPGLQRIEVENRLLVSDEGPQASHTLSAGCPGVQRIDAEKCQLVSEGDLQALCA